MVHWEGYSRAWHTLHFTLLLVCLGSLVHLSTVQWWIIKRFFFFLQCSAERGLLKESLVLYTQGQICGHYMFLYWPKLANKDLLCRAFSYLYKTGFTLRFVQRITMHNKPSIGYFVHIVLGISNGLFILLSKIFLGTVDSKMTLFYQFRYLL